MHLFVMFHPVHNPFSILQVFIKTPTSTATGYFVFPQEDFSSAELTAAPIEVFVNISI